MALPALYAILDTESVSARRWAPSDVCLAWLSAGVRLIQLRAKAMGTGALVELAGELASQCAASGATFIVNDRADVAALAGAGGVHVGQDDLSPAEVRRCVGVAAVVGLSTHDGEQVEAGVREPVSYLAIGPIYSTSTKVTGYEGLGLDAVRHAAGVTGRAGVPLVAIGGITIERAAAVREAGAESVAVISDLLDGSTLAAVESRARLWLRALA